MNYQKTNVSLRASIYTLSFIFALAVISMVILSGAMSSSVYAQSAPIAVNDEPAEHPAGTPLDIIVLSNDLGDVSPSTVKLLDPDTGVELTEWDEPGEGRWTVNVATGIVTFTGCTDVDIPYPSPLCTGLFTGEAFPMEYRVANNDGLSNPAQIYVKIGEPDNTVPVTIGYFLAERSGATVHFNWQTSTETGTAGFNLLGETDDGLVQLNDELIASEVIDSVETVDYSYLATTEANTFYIQELSIAGQIDQLGPFEIDTVYGVYHEQSPDNEMKPVAYLPLVAGR